MRRGDSVAERLAWLLEVVLVRDGDRWRRHTDAELDAALGGPGSLGRVRAGAEPGDLAGVAALFGVDPAFFGDDPVAVGRVRDELLVRALRDCGVLSYLICRVRLPEATRRERLRDALSRERATNSTPGTWHDDQRVDGHDSGAAGMTATPMDLAQVHALCRELVADLGLTAPFGPAELCERLSARRGRPIRVTATDLGATSGVGHLAPTRAADRILVERNAPEPQRALVIYHEVVHILRDHLAVGDTFTCGVDTESGAYADWREWEAEVGARELARLARERPRPDVLPRAAGATERGIAAAFGFTHGR